MIESKTLNETADESVATSLFVEIAKSLRDEILRDKESRRSLILEVLRIWATVMAIGIANVAGIGSVAFVYPILSLFLAGEWLHDNESIGRNRRYLREAVEKPKRGSYITWEVHREIVKKLLKVIEREKQGKKFRRIDQEREMDKKTALIEQLLQTIQAEVSSIIGQPIDVPVPLYIVEELAYALEVPKDLIPFSARGIFLTTQALATFVGSISIAVGLLQQVGWMPHWALITIAVVFVPLNLYAMYRTYRFLQHRR